MEKGMNKIDESQLEKKAKGDVLESTYKMHVDFG